MAQKRRGAINFEWICHICGQTRPDKCISVYVKPIIVKGIRIGEQNIRYCNDNSECYNKAKDFSFIKEPKDG